MALTVWSMRSYLHRGYLFLRTVMPPELSRDPAARYLADRRPEGALRTRATCLALPSQSERQSHFERTGSTHGSSYVRMAADISHELLAKAILAFGLR